MREIRFRGLGVDGKWWYGEIKPQGENHINLATFFANIHAGALRPETVGEYTGLHDKNGKEIYEGDIVDILPDYALPDGIVAWDKDFAGFVVKHPKYDDFVELSAIRVVVTNIYENPELIKEESCKQ